MFLKTDELLWQPCTDRYTITSMPDLVTLQSVSPEDKCCIKALKWLHSISFHTSFLLEGQPLQLIITCMCAAKAGCGDGVWNVNSSLNLFLTFSSSLTPPAPFFFCLQSKWAIYYGRACIQLPLHNGRLRIHHSGSIQCTKYPQAE